MSPVNGLSDHDVVFRRGSANSCWRILLETEKQVTQRSYIYILYQHYDSTSYRTGDLKNTLSERGSVVN